VAEFVAFGNAILEFFQTPEMAQYALDINKSAKFILEN